MSIQSLFRAPFFRFPPTHKRRQRDTCPLFVNSEHRTLPLHHEPRVRTTFNTSIYAFLRHKPHLGPNKLLAGIVTRLLHLELVVPGTNPT